MARMKLYFNVLLRRRHARGNAIACQPFARNLRELVAGRIAAPKRVANQCGIWKQPLTRDVVLVVRAASDSTTVPTQNYRWELLDAIG